MTYYCTQMSTYSEIHRKINFVYMNKKNCWNGRFVENTLKAINRYGMTSLIHVKWLEEINGSCLKDVNVYVHILLLDAPNCNKDGNITCIFVFHSKKIKKNWSNSIMYFTKKKNKSKNVGQRNFIFTVQWRCTKFYCTLDFIALNYWDFKIQMVPYVTKCRIEIFLFLMF